MKEFRENFKPIEIKLINIEGKEFVLKSSFFTARKLRKIEEIVKDKAKTETQKAIMIMIEHFGNKEKFYDQFSPGLIIDVALFLAEEQKKN